MHNHQHDHLNAVDIKLPLIPWTLNRNVDDEPQPVTAKPAPSAVITLNTNDLPAGVPRNDFVISNNIQYFSNVSRIKPIEAAIENFITYNVNERNNTITFYSVAALNDFTVDIPIGAYTDPNDLRNAIVTAMNTVSGTSLIIFTASAFNPLEPFAYTITGTGFWYFVNTCSAVTKGDTVYGLPTDETIDTVQKIGPMGLQYTSYIDIVSNTLTKYGKLASTNSAGRPGVFARMYPKTRFSDIPFGYVSDSFVADGAVFNFRPSENVTSIDIRLIDSHGDPLLFRTGIRSNFRLTFAVEL